MELKCTITEIKKSLEEFNSRFELAKQRISQHEKIPVEHICSKEQEKEVGFLSFVEDVI